MRAIICESWRPYDELEVKKVAEPCLEGVNDVRIRIAHSGVSWATTLLVSGRYQRKPPLPFIPGTEIAGTVIETGSAVEGLEEGDRVCAVLDYGGYAEQTVVHARHVFKVPSDVALDVVTALPISYMTAFGALCWRAKLRAGEKVLIHGATGGVGLAAVDIALALGCEVYAVVRGEHKVEFLRQRGAHHVIDRDASEFRDAIKHATHGRGIDVTIDPVGGPVLAESLRCLHDDGRHVVIGFVHGEIPQIPANTLLLKNISVCGFNLGHYLGWGIMDERERYASRYRAGMEQLIEWAAEHRIRPVVYERRPLEEFREAMAMVTGGNTIGRVLLDP